MRPPFPTQNNGFPAAGPVFTARNQGQAIFCIVSDVTWGLRIRAAV